MMDIQIIIVGQLGVNCYICIDAATNAAVVIDPGDEPEKIEKAVKTSGLELNYIILTHGHPDHSFAAGELQKRFDGVDVLMNEADVPQLEGNADLVAMFFDIDKYIAPKLGRFLADGDIVRFGVTELKVITTPGHTPGSLCLLTDNILFTGDTLFAGGIGRTDLKGGSYNELMQSIRGKLLALPDETIIYPGHGPTSSIGLEREDNPWIG